MWTQFPRPSFKHFEEVGWIKDYHVECGNLKVAILGVDSLPSPLKNTSQMNVILRGRPHLPTYPYCSAMCHEW